MEIRVNLRPRTPQMKTRVSRCVNIARIAIGMTHIILTKAGTLMIRLRIKLRHVVEVPVAEVAVDEGGVAVEGTRPAIVKHNRQTPLTQRVAPHDRLNQANVVSFMEITQLMSQMIALASMSLQIRQDQKLYNIQSRPLNLAPPRRVWLTRF